MAAASECMPARSSTAQWEVYLSRYVRESADFDALTEEKIWSVLNEHFADVPVTARSAVRAMGERIVADFTAAILDSEDEEDGLSMVELAHRHREAKVEEAKKMAEQEALDAKKATEANEQMQATKRAQVDAKKIAEQEASDAKKVAAEQKKNDYI